jgi:hypothetical protein
MSKTITLTDWSDEGQAEYRAALDNKFIQGALAVDEVSTHFRIEFAPDTARAFVRIADAYNGFNQCDLVNLIDAVNDAIPPMLYGPGNPNNGRPHHKFLIGNEGSRVIYVNVTKAYLPASFNYAQLTSKLKAIGRRAHADEMDETGTHSYQFRYWWD